MTFAIIVLAYILCHGVTTLVVSPLQSAILPDVTIFASLVYLPHGVRVLSTWAYGWKAIPALAVGASISAWLFRPAEELNFLEPALLEGILFGASSAFVAFELMRFAGYNFYFGRFKRLSWKGLITIGAISSVINSIGQTLVFSGLIGLDHVIEVLVIYAVGDLVGLIACMLALMFAFRWVRKSSVFAD